jgi:hypothetical protein
MEYLDREGYYVSYNLAARGASQEEGRLGVLDGLGRPLLEGSLGAGIPGFSVSLRVSLQYYILIPEWKRLAFGAACLQRKSPSWQSMDGSGWLPQMRHVLEVLKKIKTRAVSIRTAGVGSDRDNVTSHKEAGSATIRRSLIASELLNPTVP